LTVALIVAWLWRASRREVGASAALWLPVLWLAVIGSRFVSQWLSWGAGGPVAVVDGSPVDSTFFAAMNVLGALVLIQRRRAVVRILRDNPLVVVILLYAFASIAWSDFPFVSFKRYVKALGHPIMALVVATDPQPQRALQIVLRRCAILLLPASILVIKYFPEIGRYYDGWGGAVWYQGVAIGKNALAQTSMLFGVLFLWLLITGRSAGTSRPSSMERLENLAGLAMAGWLLWQADSDTSLSLFLIGGGIVLALKVAIVRRHAVLWFGVVFPMFVALAAATPSIRLAVLGLLGRDPTFTDRTLLWADTLAIHDAVSIGGGFEAFWLGARLDILWEQWWWRPIQAHNGYLELYLHLGAIGLTLQLALIVVVMTRLLVAARRGDRTPFARTMPARTACK
jgi:O-antigen ligase